MPRADRHPGGAGRRFYGAVRFPLTRFANWALDLRVTGQENLPPAPYVIAANHLSFVDPVLVSLAAGRNVRYLAVAGLFGRSRGFDRLISFFGAIPTPRDRAPVSAVRAAIAELEAGYPVGVFPEGRRVERWGDETPQRGAAWLALATGVPLVPVAVFGSQGTLGPLERTVRRTAVRMWVETPLDPTSFLDHVDPVAAISVAWAESVAARLGPWWPAGREPDEERSPKGSGSEDGED